MLPRVCIYSGTIKKDTLQPRKVSSLERCPLFRGVKWNLADMFKIEVSSFEKCPLCFMRGYLRGVLYEGFHYTLSICIVLDVAREQPHSLHCPRCGLGDSS